MLKAFRGSNMGLFNNAASSWNHEFFWKCLRFRAFLCFSCVRAWQLNSFPALLVAPFSLVPMFFLGGGSSPRLVSAAFPSAPVQTIILAHLMCVRVCVHILMCAYVCAYLAVHRAEGFRRQT